MDEREGRCAISGCGYRTICKVVVALKPQGRKYDYEVFGWAFMTFCWNLIARGTTVQTLMLQHLCILFQYKDDFINIIS